jgi:endonuclease IV
VTLRVQITFDTGHIFDAFEGFSRQNTASQTARKFSYYFGHGNSNLFLFDTHGQYGPGCHLELGEGRIFEGDDALNGFSLADMDFPKAFGIIHKFFDGKSFPWERQ